MAAGRIRGRGGVPVRFPARVRRLPALAGNWWQLLGLVPAEAPQLRRRPELHCPFQRRCSARVAALHTFFYLLLTVPAEVGLGLAAAWMTLRVTRGQGLLAAVFLIPLVVPWTVAGTLFYGLFNIHGVADRLSQDVFGGGSSFIWLDHPRLAFGVIVAFGIWKGAPWSYLLLLGALSACPNEVFEAARIDGARGFSFWWRVVLPAIRPMLVFVIVLRLLAEAQTFNSVAMLTNGAAQLPGSDRTGWLLRQRLGLRLLQLRRSIGHGDADRSRPGYCGRGWVDVGFPSTRRQATVVQLRACAEQKPSLALGHKWVAPPPERRARPAHGARGHWRHPMQWAKRGRWALLSAMVVLVLLPFAGEAEFWLGRNEFAGTYWPAIETGVWNTLALSAATLVGTLVLAVPAAYFLAYGQSQGRGVLFVFVLFTLAVPGVIFILPQFEEIVWLGLVNTRIGIVALYITANLPLAVFFLRPAFAGVPVPLVEAIRVDGASGFGILRRLVLRLSSSTIIALSVLMVVWVWGELPIAQAVLNSNNQSASTLPLLLVNGNIGNPNAVYLISLAAPLLLFLSANRYFRRGLMSGSLL